MFGKVGCLGWLVALLGACQGAPRQGAEAEGMATLEPPAALLSLHAGGPFVQTTWGPDVTAAEVATMGAALPSMLAEQARVAERQAAALAGLEHAVGTGQGSLVVAAAAQSELDAELDLFLADLDAVARLGSALAPSAWAKRAEHGPVAILLLAVTDHPLARDLDPYARLGGDGLTKEESRLVAEARGEAHRARLRWRAACVALVPELRALGVSVPLEPATYRDVAAPAVEAWQEWRRVTVIPFASFVATLPSTRRQQIIDSGAFRRAVYPTPAEVASTAAP